MEFERKQPKDANNQPIANAAKEWAVNAKASTAFGDSKVDFTFVKVGSKRDNNEQFILELRSSKVTLGKGINLLYNRVMGRPLQFSLLLLFMYLQEDQWEIFDLNDQIDR